MFFILYFFIWCSFPVPERVLQCVLIIRHWLVNFIVRQSYERPPVCCPVCCEVCSRQMHKSVPYLLDGELAFRSCCAVTRDKTSAWNRHVFCTVIPLT